MNFPFSKSALTLKTKELQEQISQLENKLDEQVDEYMDYYVANKSIIDSNGSEPISGQFGLVDEQYDKAMLQKLYMTETWFYIAVSAVAETIASLPFKLEKKKIIKQNVEYSNGQREEVYKETWIDAGAEPEAEIFKFPNEIQTPYDFWFNLTADLLATGDAYIYPHKSDMQPIGGSEERLRDAISRVRKTDVDALFRINSAVTEIIPSEEDGKFIDGYAVLAADKAIKFDVDDIVHMKMPNPSDPFYGLAPIVPVMKKVLLDRYTDEHHMRFYKQGARLGGVIETEKNLTKEQMHRLTTTFESKFTGKRQHHKTLILPKNMKYKTIEVSPVDGNLIEFSKTNKEPVMAAYKVPPIKVGLLDGATYANALIQNKTFYENAIMPITTLMEQSINQSAIILKSTRNLRFKFDFSQVPALQEDFKSKAESGKEMLASGLCPNEVREIVWGKGPIEGGDTLTIGQQQQAIPFTLSAPAGEHKQEATNAQNDTASLTDIVPTEVTFEARVAQLINEAVAEGIEVGVATPIAIQQAFAEGFEPVVESEPVDEDNEKDAKHTHMDSKGVRTGKAISSGSDLHYHMQYSEDGKEIGQTSAEEEGKSHVHVDLYNDKTTGPRGGKFYESHGTAPFSKEALTGYAKVLSGAGVDAMINEREEDAIKFFERLKTLVLGKVKKKAFKKGEGFGIKIALPNVSEFKIFIDKEADRTAESLLKASKHGYKNNIPGTSITFPNDTALSSLKKLSTRNVTSVTKTSLTKLKNIITSSVSEQVSVSEVKARIEDALEGMKSSQAATIARTETLTAVSVGQDLKRAEFQRLFPKDAPRLRRVWISADDAKVRDSHDAQDGMVRIAGKDFPNGLKYPRDPAGDAGEVINCRCSYVDFLPEDTDEILNVLGAPSDLA